MSYPGNQQYVGQGGLRTVFGNHWIKRWLHSLNVQHLHWGKSTSFPPKASYCIDSVIILMLMLALLQFDEIKALKTWFGHKFPWQGIAIKLAIVYIVFYLCKFLNKCANNQIAKKQMTYGMKMGFGGLLVVVAQFDFQRWRLVVSNALLNSDTLRLALWLNNWWDAVVPSMIFYYSC